MSDSYSHQLREWLDQHPGSTAYDIADGTGLPLNRVRAILESHRHRGHIDSDRVQGQARYWLQSRPAKDVKGTVALHVYNVLRAGEPMTATQVAKATSKHAGSVSGVLRSLEAQGLVKRDRTTYPHLLQWVAPHGPPSRTLRRA
jgi:DNA-binding IclR family transcriptional regulator